MPSDFQRLTRRTLLTTAAASAAIPTLAQASPYWPSATDWETTAPGAAGFAPDRLAAAVETALASRSRSVLVLGGGRIVVERYAAGWGPDQAMEVASVGKSLLAVLIAMAIGDGLIQGFDQKAADFFPEWADDPRSAITIRHLLAMTSGLDDRNLALRNIAGDQYALNVAAPLAAAPGTRWAYNTAAYHLLFHLLARAAKRPFEAYAQDRLLGPLGMSGTRWLTSPGQGATGPVTNYYTAICTGRDLARFGLFAQRGGVWNSRRLVDPGLFQTLIQPSQALNPSYGLLWWCNAKPGVNAIGRDPGPRFPGAPPDTFAALGAGGQAVMVAPSRDVVVVRQGQAPGAESMLPELLAGVLAAIRT